MVRVDVTKCGNLHGLRAVAEATRQTAASQHGSRPLTNTVRTPTAASCLGNDEESDAQTAKRQERDGQEPRQEKREEEKRKEERREGQEKRKGKQERTETKVMDKSRGNRKHTPN